MQLTRAVDYGLRTLVFMAARPEGTRFCIGELARRTGVPRFFLGKVMKPLLAAGLVRSHRGVKGGFSLGRPAADMDVRQVVEAIDGPLSVMHCLGEPGSCSRVGACGLQPLFHRLRDGIARELEAVTLRDLAALEDAIPGGGRAPGGPR